MDTKVISTGIPYAKLPESYIRPESDRPNLSQVEDCENVPVIDLACQDRDLKIQQIVDACTRYGFFQKSPEDIRVAKRLRRFRDYSHQEEEEEKFLGVSTKLKLFDDPWKIRKVLKESDCNRLCRLMLAKDLVKKNIIDVWNRVGYAEEVAKIRSKEGVGVKVLDYDRDKEYELTFKNLPSSDCYVFGHNWSPKFVKERRLKRGDEIGMYWSNMHSRFVISVLARAPAP